MRELPSVNVRGNDWIELKVWLEEELKALATSVLSKDIAEKEADFLRGSAGMIQRILNLETRLERRSLQASE